MCAAVAIVLLPSCKDLPLVGTDTARREPVSVCVQDITIVSSNPSSGYVGTVEPSRTALISSRHSGTLATLEVRKGERVSKGQVIATVESQSVKSAYDMAQASLAQAEDGYRRARQVHESGSIADVKMVEVDSKLKQARAAAEAASKALEECTIRAPFDGVVNEIFAEEGVSVDPLGPVARLVDISSPEIRFAIPENEIRTVSEGQKVSIEIGALRISGIPARIESKGVVASPLSHCYECTAALQDTIPGLMPGMVCKVSLSGGGVSGAVIPSSIVRTGGDGRYVWLVRDGIVYRQSIRVGGFSGKGVLVTDGLAEGDQVIVRGYQKVSSGMKVKIER